MRGADHDNYIASTLDTEPMRHIGRGDGAENLLVPPTVTSKWSKGSSGPAGDEVQNLVASTMVPAGAGVRRLTPLECERLMGWPDDHTRWAADGTEVAPVNRYRMCGNGVVAPVAEWIGHRLMAVDEGLGATA